MISLPKSLLTLAAVSAVAEQDQALAVAVTSPAWSGTDQLAPMMLTFAFRAISGSRLVNQSLLRLVDPGDRIEQVIDVVLLELRRLEVDVVADQQPEPAVGRVEELMPAVAGRRPAPLGPGPGIQLAVVQRDLARRVHQHERVEVLRLLRVELDQRDGQVDAQLLGQVSEDSRVDSPGTVSANSLGETPCRPGSPCRRRFARSGECRGSCSR